MRDNFAAVMLEEFIIDWDRYYPRPYDLVFDPLTMAGASATPTTGNKNVPQDWSYVLTGIYCDIWNATYLASPSTQLLPDNYDASVWIFDKGASDYLSDGPVPIQRYRSLGNDRFVLPVPYLIQQNTTVTQSILSADTRTFRVNTVFHGYKVAERRNPVKNGRDQIAQMLRELLNKSGINSGQ